jgi:hypothetical protein
LLRRTPRHPLPASRAEATGDEPMSDDPDFQKANHALQVLRQARSGI